MKNQIDVKLKTVCIPLTLILIAVILLSSFIGTTNIHIKDFLTIFLNKVGFSTTNDIPATKELIIWNIRLPRVLLACVIGGGLSIVGAVMQAIFKNPMAEPSILGWSNGGALLAVIAIYTGLSQKYYLLLPFLAFTGTLATAFIVYKVSKYKGVIENTTLLLSGIAVGSLFVSLTTFVLSVANVWSMKEMLFWLMGGVDGRSWDHFSIAFFPVIACSFGIMFFAKDLNLILLGEDTAKTSGVNTERTLIWLIVLSSLIVGASVSVSGVIGFVGLIIPHIVRLIIGVDHRILLPVSFLAGAIFLPLADLLARTVMSPQELRLGIITSLIGVPFFIYLLRKSFKMT